MLYPLGKGRYSAEAKNLWQTLVPTSGQADTVQGELIRCITRLGGESMRNGNANWDAGFKIMATYLGKHLADGSFNDVVTKQITSDIALIIASGKKPDNGAYIHEQEDSYTRLTDRVVEWCQSHPVPLPHEQNAKLKR